MSRKLEGKECKEDAGNEVSETKERRNVRIETREWRQGWDDGKYTEPI